MKYFYVVAICFAWSFLGLTGEAIEEIELDCEYQRFYDGTQGNTNSYWYTHSGYVSVPVEKIGKNWCVDSSTDEFRNGFTIFDLSHEQMKEIINDHYHFCQLQYERQKHAPKGENVQQCQQRQQWFSYSKESLKGKLRCSDKLDKLSREVFEKKHNCNLVKAGKKNSYRFL